MKLIVAVPRPVSPLLNDPGLEPTAAELTAIETEMPLIQAEIDELDVIISTLDRPVTPWDHRRLRKARRRVLLERQALANRLGLEEAA